MFGSHYRRTKRKSGRHRALTRVQAVGGAVLVGAVGAVGALPGTASAAPAVTCGATISTPGTYVLGADCTGDGITINTSNVTLKLNGHTMTSTGAADGVLVDDSAGPISGVTVQGPGAITGYGDEDFGDGGGVELGLAAADGGIGHGVSNSIVSGLTITDSATAIALSADSTNDTIRDNDTNNNIVGIDVYGTDNTINDNNTGSPAVVGIDLDYGSSGNTANLNTADNDFLGIAVYGNNNTVNNNTINNDSSGIDVEGSGNITNNNT